MTGSDAEADANTHLVEWQTARTQISAVDDNLHDLRKYGFTFLTALLAAESVLLPYAPSSSGSNGLPDYVKLGVFLVTLLLIVALHLIDQNYIVLQEAAATRARVLERSINIELTEIIHDRYVANNVPRRVLVIYLLFAAGVALLGGFVFAADVEYDYPLVAAFAVTVAGIFYSKSSLSIKYRWRGDARDWTVEPLNCVEGDLVRITLTNLTPKGKKIASGEYEGMFMPDPVVLPANQPVWAAETESGDIKEMMVPSEAISVYESYTWLWDTKGVGTGVFQVRPLDRPLPLSRKVIILPRQERPSASPSTRRE